MDARRIFIFFTGLVGLIAIILLLISKGFEIDNVYSAVIELVGVILAIGIFDAISKPKSLKNSAMNAVKTLAEKYPSIISNEKGGIYTLKPQAPLFKIEPLYNGIVELNISYKILSAFNYSKTPKANIPDEEKTLIYESLSKDIKEEIESYLNENYGKKLFSGTISIQQSGKTCLIKIKFDTEFFKPKEYEELLIDTCSKLMDILKHLN